MIYYHHGNSPCQGVLKKWIMRINLTIIAMIAFFLQVSAGSYAQRITLNERNASFETIINSIQAQSGYDFIGNTNLIKNARPISIHVTQVSLKEALDLCFADQQLVYVLKDRTVVVKERPASVVEKVLDFFNAADIEGKVTDEKGAPLVGATIRVKDARRSVATNVNGEFSLRNIDENAIIQIYYIGYKTRELSVKSLKTYSVIKLEVNTGELDEVAVTYTGYQKIKTEQLTGSVSSINTKAYESVITTNNFLQGLQNKLPGLLINNDLKFEGNSLFQVRGISTISANKQPLVVVDGYPTELSLDAINPNEIESVTLLKDAAAAAIYGVRASNGVIIVERKKAKRGDTKFEFRSTLSITPKEDYSTYRLAPVKTPMNYRIDSYYRNGGQGRDYYIKNPGMYAPGTEPMLDLSAMKNPTKADTLAMVQKMNAIYDYDNTKDFSRLFEQNKVTQQYDFNLSGGSDKALYFISSNFTRNQFSSVKNDDRKFLLSGRGTYTFNSKLSFRLTADFSQSRANAAPKYNYTDFASFERFQDSNGNALPSFAGSPTNPLYNPGIMALGYYDNLNYPLTELNEERDINKLTMNKIVGDLSYKIIPDLTLTLGGVYEYGNQNKLHYASENSSQSRQYVNYYSELKNGSILFNLPRGGYQTTTVSSTLGYTFRGQLSYNKKLNEDHSLNLIAGAEMRKIVNEASSFANFGYNEQTMLQMPVDYTKILGTDYWPNSRFPQNPVLRYTNLFNKAYQEDRYVSAYFNGVYAYQSKYILSASLRIDQSNLFGTDPKYQFKPLWSVGAAWNIEKEAFMKSLTWVNSLKLRLSEGFNGNVSKESLPQIVAKYALNNRTQPNATSLNIISLENSSLRWEETNNFNAGLDFTLFNRISGSVDYYLKKSKDLLANAAIDPTKGAAATILNSARIQNKGLEFTLNGDWIQRKDFNWNTGIAFSYNTSKVIDVYQNNLKYNYQFVDGSVAANYIVGYPVGSLFSYRFAGLNSLGLPTVYDQNHNAKQLSYSSNDEGIRDLDYSGNSIPAYTFGMSNRFDVGPFYFYFMVDFNAGFKTRIPRPLPSSIRPIEGAENYFRNPGDEKNTDVMGFPGTYSYDSNRIYSVYNNSDTYVVNAAYLLLRDVTASYRLNSTFLKRIGFSNFELKAQGTNLYTHGFNKYNYSVITGSYMRRNLVPTFTLGLFTNF